MEGRLAAGLKVGAAAVGGAAAEGVPEEEEGLLHVDAVVGHPSQEPAQRMGFRPLAAGRLDLLGQLPHSQQRLPNPRRTGQQFGRQFQSG